MDFHDKKDVEKYIEMIGDYQGSENIEILHKYLKKGSTVLELGMGTGADLKILAKNYNVTGSDYSEVFLSKFKQQNQDINAIKLNAVTMDTKDKFDCIYSNKVLHHLSRQELKTSLKNQCSTLNSKGLLMHSFWLGEGEKFYGNTRFAYYNLQELIELFENKDFNVLCLQKYKEMEDNDSALIVVQKNI